MVTGHGAFIMPFFRKARFLTMAMCEAEVEETCVKIGLSVDALQIQSIDDGSLGYILAMSAPHNAAIQQQAQIAQARANLFR